MSLLGTVLLRSLPATILRWGIVVVLVGIWLLSAFVLVSELRQLVRLVRMDPVDVRAATPGETVEIEGQVEPVDGTVTEPVAGVRTVACETRIYEKTGGTKNRYHKKVATDYGVVPFLVDDGTGTALVYPQDVEFMPQTDDVRYLPHPVGERRRPPRDVEAELDVDPGDAPWSGDDSRNDLASHSKSASTDEGLLHETIKFERFWIEPEEAVHVRGVPRRPSEDERRNGRRSPDVVFDAEGDEYPPTSGRSTEHIVSRGSERSTQWRLLKRATLTAAFFLVLSGVLYLILF